MPAFLITDEFDHTEIVFSDNAKNAFDEWMKDRCGQQPCPDNDCYCRDNFHAVHYPRFDEYEAQGSIPLSAYLAAGWAYTCEICDYDEPTIDWEIIDGKAVCGDCRDSLVKRPEAEKQAEAAE